MGYNAERLYGHDDLLKSADDVWGKAQEIWKNDIHQYIRKLCKSMSERMLEVIERQGGAKSLLRRGKIPVRSAERYVAEFRSGNDWKRKAYPTRVKPQQTGRIRRKAVKRAKNRRKTFSTREIGTGISVSARTTRRIMKVEGFTYASCKKRI